MKFHEIVGKFSFNGRNWDNTRTVGRVFRLALFGTSVMQISCTDWHWGKVDHGAVAESVTLNEKCVTSLAERERDYWWPAPMSYFPDRYLHQNIFFSRFLCHLPNVFTRISFFSVPPLPDCTFAHFNPALSQRMTLKKKEMNPWTNLQNSTSSK